MSKMIWFFFTENTSDSSGQNPIQLNDLRNFLSTLSPFPEGDQRQAGKFSQKHGCKFMYPLVCTPVFPFISVDLAAGLNTDSIQPLLSNPAVVRELQQHLPSPIDDSGDPQERLRLTLTSPQFQQVQTPFLD